MMRILFLSASALMVFSCRESAENRDSKAHQLIETCVETHGGDHYRHFDVSFDFRKFRVRLNHDGPHFRYERASTDSLNQTTQDVLTDQGFERLVNGKRQTLSPKDEDKYREGVNSVAYFALLPYKLLDKAVNAEHLGSTEINGELYDKIKVWFDKEGGGKDHDDVFCYWINQKTHRLDYLAYDNGGPRFRKATRREVVQGITFQDYENYEIPDTTLKTSDYDGAFKAGKAKLLSKIEQVNYRIER